MHKCAKFAPRNEHGIFAGCFLQPGGRWKGEYLEISFEQLIKATGRIEVLIEVKRVRECALVPGPLTFPLKTVRDIQIDEDLREASERLEQSDPFVEGELLELEDGNLPPDDDDGATVGFHNFSLRNFMLRFSSPKVLLYIFVDTMSDFKGLGVSSGNSVMKLCPVGPQGPTRKISSQNSPSDQN